MSELSNSELNSLVAEKVMGWHYVKTCSLMPHKPKCNGPVDGACGCLIPEYSTSIEAAWKVIEKLRESVEQVTVEWEIDHWHCYMFHENGTVTSCESDTAPRAICLTAVEVT